MSRVAYVNGQYVPFADASVHIEDRGLQFADSIYEVWGVRAGRFLDTDGHIQRLIRSLGELAIPMPMTPRALMLVLAEVTRRNRVRNGMVYLQITRGVARRDHAFPSPAVPPTVIITAKPQNTAVLEAQAARGARVITVADIRWGRCDIKTTALTANVLAKQAARQHGAQEAWMLDADGYITEGSSTNAWIIDRDGVLRTRPASDNILNGITRRTVIALAAQFQLPVSEVAFTVDDVLAAREAFFTAATALVTPVTHIDGKVIGSGQPGPMALRLREAYLQQA